ncbi:hypothetical protein LWI29_016576 [Acer saccharum]|uniref:BED-type domain-containing protein n=1 Tax=Acer saccharum TaxID=4024 RepID=A0AA39VIZ6_ACESA|nr:hypothetical protein LWI29_016576 [Acer saccharum]
MASGSGSGGDGSRNVNRGKGHVENLLHHIGDAIIADDVTFQQFIEDRFGSNQPSTPIPPQINPEFDGLNPAYNTPNIYENVSNPPPPSDDFFAGEGDAEEEKPAKSDLFKVHMKKTNFDGTYWHIQCNYCPKKYKVPKTFEYGTLWTHVRKTHPSEYAMANNQAQIASAYEFDVQLSPCVAAMKAKWCQYYEKIPNIYLLALCFDPRFKLECLQVYLSNCYKCLDLEVDVLDCCDSVKTLLYELYDEYLKIYGQSLNVPVSQPQPTSGPSGASSSSSKFKLQGLGDLLFSQRSKKLKTSSSSSSAASELDRYLEDEHKFLDEKFSLQDWWKSHQQDYPILAIIAKQILGTPVSTVAVEQEFSAGGNILDPRRSVMCPQSLEMQACVDDWTKEKYRQQELQPEIVNDFFEGDQTTGTEGSE